jgi:hypothetical protein
MSLADLDYCLECRTRLSGHHPDPSMPAGSIGWLGCPLVPCGVCRGEACDRCGCHTPAELRAVGITPRLGR